jgi:hypothetical protein
MPDTIKERATLISDLADNTSEDISAQIFRDVLVSSAVYGEVRVEAGNTAQGSIGTTPLRVTAFNANGPGSASTGITPDHTNDRLTVGSGAGGTFRFGFCASVKDATAAALFRFEVYKNGVTATALRSEIVTDASGSRFTVSISGLLASVVATDFFEIFVVSDSAGRTMTVTEAQFNMERKA